jgi:ornithine cyclodeaminase/alanine dehydrogenase-like protein (mu-crystallin family)
MPAWDKATDAAGMKWVSTYPSNGQRGIRTVDALIILNRAGTGEPTTVLEAGLLTAARTAAMSGAAMKLCLPPSARRCGLIGAGLQGGCHVEILSVLLPDIELRIFDRHSDRAAALADRAVGMGIRNASAASTAAEAADGAQLVVSAAALGSAAEKLEPAALAADALIVAVDSDTYVSSEMARGAGSFIVDDKEKYMANVAEGVFEGYPQPRQTLGEVLLEQRPTRPSGLVLVTWLGMGIVDLVFAAAVQREAEARGLGTMLAREASSRSDLSD